MPGPGNASSIQVSYIREATQNVLPAGNMAILPWESFQLSSSLNREQAGNVSANRQVPDNPPTDIKVSGSAKSDFLYSAYDGQLEELFCATKATAFSLTATTLSAVASGNAIHNTAGASFAGLADGDMVLVTGFVTNGAVFLGHVSGAPTTNDLTLDSFVTLVNESAGPTVTIAHAGRLRLGASMLTGHYETWNLVSGVGDEHGGIGVSQLALSVPHPTRCSMAWTLQGISSKKISAQLANARTASSTNPPINSNRNFGDTGTIGAGLGFRYGAPGASALMPSLRIKKWDLTIVNKLMPEGGAGTLGPIDMSLDGRFDIKLSLTALRNTAAAETIYGDGQNPDSLISMGIGFKDSAGHRQYIWLPALQPTDPKDSGLGQNDREKVDVTYMAKASATDPASMIQWTMLG